jgi:aryl-alcohol dehydrogenase-like predicted oxidoreductase
MKLVIGSAQIGMNYGLYNKEKITQKEFKKIEKLVLRSGINFIDTASSYGKSENIIGNSKLRNLNIITKIKLPTKKNINIQKWVSKEVSKSLEKLKIKKIYGLLIHDYKDLLGESGKSYLYSLQELKRKKIIKKIGISIYDSKEIKKIWKFWKPDLIQVPLNLFDNRILNSGWINILKKFKIQIYARSVFLQGLLINDYSLFNFNKKCRPLLDDFKDWCYKKKISQLKACIHFVKQYKKIDYLVVGFNSYFHLKEIIDVFKKKQIIITRNFSTNNLNLIDPRRWSTKKSFSYYSSAI